MDIPESVVAAAEYVASWASENSRDDSWEIGRCASRHELVRLRAKNERLRAALQEIADAAIHLYEDGWVGDVAREALEEKEE